MKQHFRFFRFIIAVAALTFLLALPMQGFSQNVSNFRLMTTAFSDGGVIPDRYTCAGENVSPQLAWTGVPDGTKSFVISMDDLDGPTGSFTHWLVYNIGIGNAGLVSLSHEKGTGGMTLGVNDFQKLGYDGPCPTAGSGPHHYFIRAWALDSLLNLEQGADKNAVGNAMQGHVLGVSSLVGIYEAK